MKIALAVMLGLCALTAPALAASPLVSAMETSLFAGIGFSGNQIHINATPGNDESGILPGATIGAGFLLPAPGAFDYYGSLNYQFNGGRLDFNGHAANGMPINADDNAAFNRVEARLGMGFVLPGGGEAIPFLAAGYQSWNRAVSTDSASGASAFYHTPMVGLGAKLDLPLGNILVASAGGEVLALAGGGIDSNSEGVTISPSGFGVTPEERVELGLNGDFMGPWHVFAQAYWTHFTYSGTKPGGPGGYYEPLSGTMQEGVNLGVGYSFW